MSDAVETLARRDLKCEEKEENDAIYEVCTDEKGNVVTKRKLVA